MHLAEGTLCFADEFIAHDPKNTRIVEPAQAILQSAIVLRIPA